MVILLMVRMRKSVSKYYHAPKGTASLKRLDYKVEKVAKKVKSIGGPEWKYYDIENSSQTIDQAGTVIDLTANIAQGTTDVTRIGDRLRIRKVELHYQVQANSGIVAAAAMNQVNCHICLVKDKQNVATTAGQIFDNNSSLYAALNLKDFDRRKRYDFYGTRTFSLDSRAKLQFKCMSTIKLDMYVQYIAAGTTVATNALKFVYLSDNPPSLVTNPNITYAIRVWYTDM